MKKFELNEDDINNLIDKHIGYAPENHIYVQSYEKIRANLNSYLELINSMLETKYNKPREAGKRRQQVTGWNVSAFKKDKTYTAFEKWYKSSVDLFNTGKKPTLAQISRDTKLHINTVRNFLQLHQDKLNMDKGTSISISVMDILSKVFKSESMV